jgi:hypothetical protein
MGKIGVLVRFPAMKWPSASVVVGSVLAIGAGCTTPEMSSSRQAEADAPIPVQVPMSPDQERDRADARQAYLSCLRQAAQFMKTQGAAAGDDGNLVAPLCYGQFTRFEDASTVAMSTRDKRAFDRAGDKRQSDMATDAVRQQNGLAALTPAK